MFSSPPCCNPGQLLCTKSVFCKVSADLDVSFESATASWFIWLRPPLVSWVKIHSKVVYYVQFTDAFSMLQVKLQGEQIIYKKVVHFKSVSLPLYIRSMFLFFLKLFRNTVQNKRALFELRHLQFVMCTFFAVQLFPSEIRYRIFLRCFLGCVTWKISTMYCELGCCGECHGCLTAEEPEVWLFP